MGSILLTGVNGNKLVVNLAQYTVIDIVTEHEDADKIGKTVVFFTDGSMAYVEETPESIYRVIKRGF